MPICIRKVRPIRGSPLEAPRKWQEALKESKEPWDGGVVWRNELRSTWVGSAGGIVC